MYIVLKVVSHDFADSVEPQIGAGMPEVRGVVDGGPAHVPIHFPALDGDEFLEALGHGVVDLEPRDVRGRIFDRRFPKLRGIGHPYFNVYGYLNLGFIKCIYFNAL